MPHFRTFLIVANALISVVSAAVFNVTVGQNNQNVFDPSLYEFSPDFTHFSDDISICSLTGVQSGDTIGFQLYVSSHK